MYIRILISIMYIKLQRQDNDIIDYASVANI